MHWCKLPKCLDRVDAEILTIPSIPAGLGKSVQLTLQSWSLFFEGDRDMIAVFFAFVPRPHWLDSPVLY